MPSLKLFFIGLFPSLKEKDKGGFRDALSLYIMNISEYGSPSFPLKITITKNGNILIGQATGQSSFPLTAFNVHQFKFDQAALKLEFKPQENKMILRQGVGEYVLTKE